VATVSSSGQLKAKSPGQVKIYVHDNQGLKDSTVLFPIFPASLKSLTLSLRDTSYTQQLQFNLPVYVTNVTGLGIISSQFTLTFDPAILQAISVQTAGTMTSGWSAPSSHITSGRIDVGLAGSTALTGQGVLVYVRMRVIPTAGYQETTNISNVLFNENINANVGGAHFTPLAAPVLVIAPNTAILTRGDSLQFHVTSGGHAPYMWSSANPSVASMNAATGFLTALTRGTTTVTVVDSFGFTATTGNITVNDVDAKIADTTIQLHDSVDVPITIEDVTGLGILSYQMRIVHDTSFNMATNVITTGTLSSGFTVTFKDTLDTLRIASAGSNALAGGGTLLKVRFKTAKSPIVDSVSALRFVQFLLNEPGPSTPTVTQSNGSLTVLVPGAFSASPTSLAFGSLTVGTSKTDTVTITNSGLGPLNISLILSNDAEYTVTPPTGSIAPSSHAQFLVKYAPTNAGTHNGKVLFTSNAPSSPDSVTFTGSGTVPYSIRKYADGDGNNATKSDQTAKKWHLTLYKDSVSAGTIVAQADTSLLSGTLTLAGKYIIVEADSGSGWTRINGNFTRYDTMTTGSIAFADTFVNYFNGVPAFTGAPTLLDFGPVMLTTSKTDTVTITNTGSGVLHIAHSQTSDGEYTVLPDTATVAVSASVKLLVRFAPTTLGLKPATWIITHNAVNSPDTIHLMGSGTQSFTLRKLSDADSNTATTGDQTPKKWHLTLYKDSVSATTVVSAADTSVLSGVLSSAGKYIAVEADSGLLWTRINGNRLKNDTISITTNALADTFINHFSGVPKLSGLPELLSFGGVIATTTKTDTVTITNTGTAPLHISNVVTTDPQYTVTPDTATVGVAGSVKLFVRFAPLSLGVKNATLIITANAAGSPDSLHMTGAGVVPYSIVKLSDADGSLRTRGDEVLKRWHLTLYKDSVSVSTVVAAADTSMLAGTLLVSGKYIAVEADSGSPWRRINGNRTRFDTITVTTAAVADTFINTTSLTGVVTRQGLPSAYTLSQNYPNPFNPTTTIAYDLPQAGEVRLIVYNVLGQELLTLVNERQTAGAKSVTFRGDNLPSGIYFYRLMSGTYESVKRMMLIK